MSKQEVNIIGNFRYSNRERGGAKRRERQRRDKRKGKKETFGLEIGSRDGGRAEAAGLPLLYRAPFKAPIY